MTADELFAALGLPVATRVDQRVPKKLFLENGAPTAADKRAITDGIEECRWTEALKPHTIGVPEYRTSDREYLEIHVLRLTLRPGAKTMRLVELVHRAIPYPLLLVHEQEGSVGLSAAHKRHSQGESGKTVLEESPLLVEPAATRDAGIRSAFAASLALARQPQASLFALYAGWLDTMVAFQAACRTGRFTLCATPEAANARKEALVVCAAADAEISRIRAAAARETQVARQASLNQALAAARAMLMAAEAKL